MWICKNDAFVSIVRKGGYYRSNGKDYREYCLCVRARVRDHLKAIFPDEKVFETPKNDYQFRSFVPVSKVAKAIHDSIMNIDYPNFKNSVENDDLHDAYSDVWSTMYMMAREDVGGKSSKSGRFPR